jgi:hypothetical protein
MAHNLIMFPAWRIELPEQADTPANDVPTLDDFLAGLRKLFAELVECQNDLSRVRAGIAEVRHDLDGLIAARRGGLGCDGPDRLGCDEPGCRCDCGYWGAGCDHPLTPDEVARWGAWDGTCACFPLVVP